MNRDLERTIGRLIYIKGELDHVFSVEVTVRIGRGHVPLGLR